MENDLITKGEVAEALKRVAYGLVGKTPVKYLPWIKRYLELVKAEIEKLEPHGRRENGHEPV